MENRVWVVLASSCFSPSLTFPPLSFFNLHSGQEGRASWEESTKQAKSGLLTPSQPSLSSPYTPPPPLALCTSFGGQWLGGADNALDFKPDIQPLLADLLCALGGLNVLICTVGL